ncbi:uncharacterized protein SOCE26_030480 [Sorangium cellulosum]|uniref:Glycosyltransferase RgtA/B/C/D-like domain-containing protein n=1 Tax=Sorangium cellulosum TaxID=56 RepID=A0A2L0EQP1_SORCE|nr:hypothetical protein [Sorangium cellulosum]AUX41627.1 uncharacterized protein SOCE26_030480 [Sorangium cellulosum]
MRSTDLTGSRGEHDRPWSRRFAAVVYFLIVTCVAGLGGLAAPQVGWDVLGYAGVVLSYESRDAAAIHGGAYGALRDAAREADVEELTRSTPYRAELAQAPDAFVEQLPFYRVRVIFSSLVYLLYKGGVNVVQAASAVAALSYALLALLGLTWMRRYLDPVSAVLVSSFVFLSFPFTQAARIPTPDGLAAFFAVAAVYVLLEKRNWRLAFAILTAAVFVRHDTAILGLMLSAGLLVLDRGERLRVRLLRFAASSAAILAAYAVVSRLGGYGWRTLFHHTFINHLSYPASSPAPVGLDDYVRVVVTSLLPDALVSYAVLYLLVLAIAAASYVRAGGKLTLNDPWLVVLALMLLHLVVRTLLFPAFWERFLLAHYLFFALFSVRLLRLAPHPAPTLDDLAPAPPSMAHVPPR